MTHFLRFTLLSLLLTSHTAFAQQASSNTETELKACLILEREGINRFKALETRANVLRLREEELRKERDGLEGQSIDMKVRRSSREDIAQFNARVDKFNSDSDQFNQTKEEFDQSRDEYDNWMAKSLKPKCAPFQEKPVASITIFYACGFDQPTSGFEQVPFCSSLNTRAEIRDCVKKAGSKAKALESCGLAPRQ